MPKSGGTAPSNSAHSLLLRDAGGCNRRAVRANCRLRHRFVATNRSDHGHSGALIRCLLSVQEPEQFLLIRFSRGWQTGKHGSPASLLKTHLASTSICSLVLRHHQRLRLEHFQKTCSRCWLVGSKSGRSPMRRDEVRTR